MHDGLIEMQVLGVRRQVPLDQVVVLLLDVDGGRVLPIVVGLSEGQAIAAGQAGVVPPRPTRRAPTAGRRCRPAGPALAWSVRSSGGQRGGGRRRGEGAVSGPGE